MAPGRVSSAVAEPLLAQIAHNDAIRLVDAAVLAGIVRQLLAVVELLIVFLKLQLAQGGRGHC